MSVKKKNFVFSVFLYDSRLLHFHRASDMRPPGPPRPFCPLNVSNQTLPTTSSAHTDESAIATRVRDT